MAALVYRGVAVFAALKLALTSAASFSWWFWRATDSCACCRSTWVLYGVLVAYLSLIGYEIWLLKGHFDAVHLVILPGGVTFHIVPPSAKLALGSQARSHSHHIDVLEVFSYPSTMSQSLADQLATTALSGGNADFIEDLYEQFLKDPNAVDPTWAAYFSRLQDGSAREIAHCADSRAPWRRANAAGAVGRRAANRAARAPNRARCRA